jgi:flagellar L-ring protein precursor FlgH
MKRELRVQKHLTIALSLVSMLMVSACGVSERVSNIGKAPTMSGIQTAHNSANNPELIKLPMPSAQDQRAHKVGDILTVNIDIKDEADLQNKTERQRRGTEQTGLPNLAGFEGYLGKVLPGGVDPSNLVGMNSTSTSTGDGKIKREEEIRMKMAAMITQVLPNGNFIIRGQQEVRVNYELRELTLDGVIRPEDILNNNSISYEKIAEARISYGGRGQVTEIQQPRYGQQFIDAVFPF